MTAAQAQISPAAAIATLRCHSKRMSSSTLKPAERSRRRRCGAGFGLIYRLVIDKHGPQLSFELPHASAEGLLFGSRHARAGSRAEQTQQEKLTILSEGLFTEMAKKAFKRPRIATPPPCSEPEFSGATPPPGHGSAAPASSHRGWAVRRRRGCRKLTIRYWFAPRSNARSIVVAIDAAVDQRHRAEELQVHGAAVHARHDAAAGLERGLELALAPERSVTERIGEVLDLDRRVERAEIAAIALDLRRQRRRIEIAGPLVRKGVAADFMAAAMQGDDVGGIDGRPVRRRRRADQPAGNIERSARVVVLREFWRRSWRRSSECRRR